MYRSNEPDYHSYRRDDERICGYVLQKAMEWLFPFIVGRFGGRASFEIINDDKLQREGVDVILNRGPGLAPYNYDLKSQFHWVNRPISTHAFEIDSYQKLNGKRTLVDGWFVNKSQKTDHYMLMAVSADTNQVGKKEWWKIRPDNINGIEVFAPSKVKIDDYLNENGLTTDRMFSMRDEMRGTGIAEKIKRETGVHGVSMVKCDRNSFSEESVNLLIEKETLAALSDFCAYATPNGIKTYKERGKLLISEYKPIRPAKAIEKPKVISQSEFSFDLSMA